MRRATLPIAAVLAVLSCACASTPAVRVAAGPPDGPVPASEPRASVKIELDLPRSASCEEAFDLALYGSRAVDLVAWDDGTRCVGRRATLRYFPRRISREELLETVRRNAERARVIE